VSRETNLCHISGTVDRIWHMPTDFFQFFMFLLPIFSHALGDQSQNILLGVSIPPPPPPHRQGAKALQALGGHWAAILYVSQLRAYRKLLLWNYSDGIQISCLQKIREMDLDLLDLQVRTGITQMQKDCEEEETTVQQQVPKNNAHLRISRNDIF
jgi:hypothetical protein